MLKISLPCPPLSLSDPLLRHATRGIPNTASVLNKNHALFSSASFVRETDSSPSSVAIATAHRPFFGSNRSRFLLRIKALKDIIPSFYLKRKLGFFPSYFLLLLCVWWVPLYLKKILACDIIQCYYYYLLLWELWWIQWKVWALLKRNAALFIVKWVVAFIWKLSFALKLFLSFCMVVSGTL